MWLRSVFNIAPQQKTWTKGITFRKSIANQLQSLLIEEIVLFLADILILSNHFMITDRFRTVSILNPRKQGDIN